MKIKHIEVVRTDEVELARTWLNWFIDNKITVSVAQARELYTDANLPIPEHLKPRTWTDEELLEADRFGRLLFKTYLN